MPFRRATLQDIADRLGLDRSTVSLALRRSPKIPEETRNRIKEVAEELGYRPNLLARGLKKQNTDTVGILVPWLRDQYFADVFNAQEMWLRNNGYYSILGVSHPNLRPERRAIESLLDRGVDALLLDYPLYTEDARKLVANLAKQGLPIVLIGELGIRGVDEVDFNIAKASYEMTRYLLSLGHRRIALVRGYNPDPREAGYLRAIEEEGMSANSELLVDFHQGIEDMNVLCQRVMSIREPATAVFAYNDDVAGQLITRFLESGYRVPGDISVVGINDDWLAQALKVPLTTIHQPSTEIAEAAASMLLDRIRNASRPSRRLVFEGDVVIRSSVARPPAIPKQTSSRRQPI